MRSLTFFQGRSGHHPALFVLSKVPFLVRRFHAPRIDKIRQVVAHKRGFPPDMGDIFLELLFSSASDLFLGLFGLQLVSVNAGLRNSASFRSCRIRHAPKLV